MPPVPFGNVVVADKVLPVNPHLHNLRIFPAGSDRCGKNGCRLQIKAVYAAMFGHRSYNSIILLTLQLVWGYKDKEGADAMPPVRDKSEAGVEKNAGCQTVSGGKGEL